MARKLLWSYLCVLVLGACSFDAGSKVDDLDDVVDEIPDPGDIDLDVKVCGDQTLSDLFQGDSISDECRDKVESFLPEAQSSFESRLVVLGHTVEATGELTIYVIGADAEGDALFETAPSEVKVSLDIGEDDLFELSEVTADLTVPADVLSLGIVNDYSASMRDADLQVVSEIETDLLGVLPAVHETEVVQFSDAVTTVQAFTEDKAALLSAVDIDSSYERGSTALYDGMGTALTSLVGRERPLKVLLVSTDGAENASTMFTEDQLVSTINGEKVVVIMLGALFADVKTLKTLSGDRGIFFYTRGYGRLKSAVAGLIESLGHIVAVHVPPLPADGTELTVEIAGQSATFSVE